MDGVCIGLTSSNRVTFAEHATAFVVNEPVRAVWFGRGPPHLILQLEFLNRQDAGVCSTSA